MLYTWFLVRSLQSVYYTDKKVNYEMCLYILAEVSTSGNQKSRDSIFSITLPPPRISNINDQTPHTFHAPLTPHKLRSLYEVLNSLLRL